MTAASDATENKDPQLRFAIPEGESLPQVCRDKAAECLRLAERAPDPATRRYWIDLAMCWQLLERRQKR
jgi:hypothetical protein